MAIINTAGITMVMVRGRPVYKSTRTAMAWGDDPDAWEGRREGGEEKKRKIRGRIIGGLDA